MTLKIRFSLAFVGYTLLALLLFNGTYLAVARRDALSAQREEGLQALEKTASVCREIYLTSNYMLAIDYIRLIRKDPAIAAVYCMDGQGVIQAHSDPARIGRRGEAGDSGDLEASVKVADRIVGSAHMRYDPAILERRVRLKLWQTMRQPLIVSSCTFVLAVGVGLLLAWSLSRPIRQLSEGARAIGAGVWDWNTPLARRSDELGSLAREMKSMSDKLRQLDELKDDFIAMVSHDLRAPLAAIESYLNALQTNPAEPLSADQSAAVRTMIESARTLALFINNVLDLSKMKAGRMDFDVKPVALDRILENTLDLFRITTERKHIGVERDFPRPCPRVLADEERLNQICMNLLSNALKFTPSKGRIAVSIRERGKFVELDVENTGPGIRPEDFQRLFKKFERLSQDRESKITGTGLGLSFTKQLVEAQGGSIRATSEPGRRTVFSLSLPKSYLLS